MRRLLLTFLAACSGSSVEPPSDAPADGLTQHVAVVHGAHGSAINLVAVTADGTAAVSQDVDANTRLWTALDGTAEPAVVRVAAAEELALLRDQDGFTIAALDQSGGLHLVRTRGSGELQLHRQIDRDVEVQQLAVTSRYILALRSDQTIAVIDAAGEERVLVTPAGSRTIAIVTRDDHAVAITVRDHAAHVRALDLGAPSWGAEIGTFRTPSSRFALSPSGTQLAYVVKTGVGVLDLTTRNAHTTCSQTGSPNGSPNGENDVTGNVPPQVPVGFVDDATLACLMAGELGWFPSAGGHAIRVHPMPDPELLAYGGTIQVSGEGLALGISDRTALKFLGYRLSDPSALRTGPMGLSIAHNSPPLVIDRSLRVTQTIQVDTLAYEDALPLDATHVLRTEPSFAGHEIVLVDTAAKTVAKIASTTDLHLHFDAATNLLAVPAEHSLLIPYSPIVHRFGTPIDLGERSRLFLTDPALAEGLVAVSVVDAGGSSKQIHEYKAGGVIAKSYEIEGDVATVDRAGRVYAVLGETVHVFVAGIFHEGHPVTTFVAKGRPVIAVDRLATSVLVESDNRISLFDLQGHAHWSIGAPTSIDVSWVEDEPLVRFASGLARLDRRDGRLLERACGWQFGLTSGMPENPGNSVSVCDAE